jgi:hypothetical protein
VLRRPQLLAVPGGFSRELAQARIGGRLGARYRRALRDASGAVGFLVYDLARRLGPRRIAAIVRGNAQPDDAALGTVLVNAERVARMLAHLHIARLLAQQAQVWPERTPIADRFMARTQVVCEVESKFVRREY